jgi:hypothetical protein
MESSAAAEEQEEAAVTLRENPAVNRPFLSYKSFKRFSHDKLATELDEAIAFGCGDEGGGKI